MRRHFLFPALAIGGLFATSSHAQIALGEWREHFPYREAVSADAGDGNIYVATDAAMFAYTPTSGEIDRLTKANALSDLGIRTVRWSVPVRVLVVGYENGNLDIIGNGRTVNLSDIKRSNILGDKSIYSIETEGELAYVCTGFGIVVIDLVRTEVRDTWFIGPNGAQLQVNDLVFQQDSIYAVTESGIYTAYRNAPNLAAFDSWHKRLDINNANGPFTEVERFGTGLLVNYRNNADPSADTLYQWDGQWTPVPQFFGVRTESLSVSADQKVAVATPGDVRWTDGAFVSLGYLSDVGGGALRPSMVRWVDGGELLIADLNNGLLRVVGQGVLPPVFPNGPKTSSAVRMDMRRGALYVATGAVEGNWASSYRKEGVFHYVDDTWLFTDRTNSPLMTTGANTFGGEVMDILDVAVDPDDPDHAFATSYDEGLLEFRGRQLVEIHNADNSSLEVNSNFGSENKIEAAGVAYDDDGNLWITNSNCQNPITVRLKNGTWKSFNPGTILNNNRLLGDILPTEDGYKWIIRPRGQGLLVFNDGGTITDASDDQYKVVTTFEGSGGLPVLDVLSVAEDLDGEIWVGTGKGIAVFYNADAIFTNSNWDAQQILIEQDGNVQILLETEAVSAILVDGANRKWMGTQSSGVFLVSADGTEQIHHFTAENSPLPSNTIISMTMDERTGEVFFGTDKGIMSYRSDAPMGGTTAECSTVFPNPVREDHTGPIAITGLVRDSDVRITDIGGNIVYSTTSLGGQAIWPGTNYNGERVSTGVYMVFSVDAATGTAKCSTKVLVIR